MSVLGIVPARLAASRFPRKPLAEIHGIPMVAHCYFRSKLSPSIDQVYVATCDLEIHEYIRSMGGRSVMTSDQHERAADRAAEALGRIESDTGSRFDYVALIQGDEPMLIPEMLDELEPYYYSDIKGTTEYSYSMSDFADSEVHSFQGGRVEI